MMCHFTAKRMFYSKIIISIEQTKIIGIFLSEIELKKKHFILLPDNDGMDEYTLQFIQM